MRFDLLDEYMSVYTFRPRANPDHCRRPGDLRSDNGRTARRVAVTVIVLMIAISTSGGYIGF